MKVIDSVILLASCVVEIYLMYTFFGCFFEQRGLFAGNKIYLSLLNCFSVLVLYTINVLGNGDINLFLFPIVTWLYTFILFYGKIGSRLLYFIMAYSIIWGSEWLFAIILHVDNEVYKKMSQMPFVILAIKLLTYIMFIIVEQLISNGKKKMDNKIFLMYLLLPISSFGMMMGIFYSDVGISSNFAFTVLMTVCYILMLLGNMILFYAFNRYSEEMYSNMENHVLITKQEADLNYYRQVLDNNENHNEFVHNTSHYLRIINRFAQQKDFDSITKIVSELDEQIAKSDTLMYSNHHILNAILSEKQQQASGENVEFDAYVEPGVNLGMVEDADLIAMLGNLLDNALRGALDCGDKKAYVRIRIYMQEIGGFCVIKILNSFSGNIIMKNDLFVSTKKDKGIHGLGIRSANKMAEKYGGYLLCKPQKDEFEAILLLSSN